MTHQSDTVGLIRMGMYSWARKLGSQFRADSLVIVAYLPGTEYVTTKKEKLDPENEFMQGRELIMN